VGPKSTRQIVVENLSVAVAMPIMLLLMEQLHDDTSPLRLALGGAAERASELRARLVEWRTARKAAQLVTDLETTLATEDTSS
jgi:hypothetical protein